MKSIRSRLFVGAAAALLAVLAACDPTTLLSDITAEATGTKRSGTVAAPEFNVTTGTYSHDQSVAISCSTDGATIHYTTDATAPSGSSTEYGGPVAVAGNGTVTRIRAIATKSGMNDSAVTEVTVTINYSQVSTPQITPDTGSYTSTQSVTITCDTTGSEIRYTTDGNDPTSTTGTIYTAAISVDATQTIKAIAYASGMVDSTVSSRTYTMVVTPPSFGVAAGSYQCSQSVTIGTTTAGATIRYTTDGTDPTSTTGTVYSSAVSVKNTQTLKAIAYRSGWTSSTVSSALYTILRYVYAANQTAGTVSVFTVGSGGALSPNSTTTTGYARPYTLAMSPNGKYLYVGNSNGATISAYAIGSNGALSSNGTMSLANPLFLRVSPDGSHLYAAAAGSSITIAVYNIASDGKLSSNSSVTLAGSVAGGMAVSRDGKSLYVAVNTGVSSNGSLQAYTISSSDGSLTTNGSAATGRSPASIEISQDSKYVYVSNYSSGSVYIYKTDLTGAPTYSTSASTASPGGLASSPDGTYLFVVNEDANTVSSFTIDTWGALTSTGYTGATGSGPRMITISPDGKNLYVANYSAGTVSTFTVGTGGSFTAGTGVSAGSGAWDITITP